MGATIPCCTKHFGLGCCPCKNCNKYISKEEAYRIVQRNALEAFENDGNFKANLYEDNDVTSRLSEEEIEALFDKNSFLKNIEVIYDRILV